MWRNYCYPMVGGAMERGESEAHDRRKFRIHWCVRFFLNLPPQTLKKTFFRPFVSRILFLVLGWDGVGRLLRCSTSGSSCRIGQSFLSCPSWVCVACLTSQNFSCFAPLNAGCPAHTSGFQSFDSVWPVRAPILLGLPPCTSARFCSSLCPPSCPTLSHVL